MSTVSANTVDATLERNLDALDRYEKVFLQLFEPGVHEPSLAYPWAESLCKTHVQEDDELLVVSLETDGQISGLIPLVRRTERFLGIPHVSLLPLSDLYGTHSDLLLTGSRVEQICALIETVHRHVDDWDVLKFSNLLEGSLTRDAVAEITERGGFRTRVVPAWASFYIKGEKSFDDYLSERSAKFRNYYRRKERHLKNNFDFAIDEVTDEEDIERAYSELLTIEEQSWKHDHGTAISAKDHQREFYGKMCREMAKAGMLHLSILRLDGKPVAYDLGIMAGNVYYYLKTSFAEEHRRASPATVLRANMVRIMLEKGMKIMNFPAEPYEWETHWTPEYRWHDEVSIYNSTPRARSFELATKIRDAVRRTGERKLVFEDARNLG